MKEPELGLLLPIDSAINSIAILISVDLKCSDCKKYIRWPIYHQGSGQFTAVRTYSSKSSIIIILNSNHNN